jgi:hypothetical protein
MTAELRDQLERAAKRSKRSLNAEIVARIERTFTEDESNAEIEAYAEWAKKNPDELSENNMVSALSFLRHLLSSAEDAVRNAERIYDQKTGEHAMTMDEDGNLVKSYEVK